MMHEGIEFAFSVRVDLAALQASWTPEQIQAFFAGLGRVLAHQPAPIVRKSPANPPGATDAATTD